MKCGTRNLSSTVFRSTCGARVEFSLRRAGGVSDCCFDRCHGRRAFPERTGPPFNDGRVSQARVAEFLQIVGVPCTGWVPHDQHDSGTPTEKRYFSPAAAAQRAVAEALYYAWKVGTIGVPPALLTGKGLIEAGKDLISLVKSKLWKVLKLRGGYSAVCWIIGVAAYVGSMAFFIGFPSPLAPSRRCSRFTFGWACRFSLPLA
jgi:hypothetical protein